MARRAWMEIDRHGTNPADHLQVIHRRMRCLLSVTVWRGTVQ
jgi:hypothetical protein